MTPLSPNASRAAPPWFVRGDLDGFFGLAVDNLIQFLLILGLCGAVCGLDEGFVVRTILPGAAVSLLVGNGFYALQARRLARRQGRRDVTALPFGINTVSLFAFVLFVMAPTYRDWLQRPGVGPEEAGEMAWKVGLAACFLSGIIEALGGLVAGWVRRVTPRAALLATLAGIAVGFISMEFLLRTYAHPLIALAPLGILLARYLGHARLLGGLPAGFLAVIVGTGLAWGVHLAGLPGGVEVGGQIGAFVGLHLPVPAIGPLAEVMDSPEVWNRIAIIAPMGLINVLGSLQCLESAEAEGDAFPTGSSLVMNGLSSIAAACFGSCFPTTLYIGHPGWKRMGARAGYSLLNAAFFTLVAFTGLIAAIARIVPIEAGMAILVWIAIIIVAQAFTATPRAHAPAVVLGLLPGLAAWGWLLIETTQQGLRMAGSLPSHAGLAALVGELEGTTMGYVRGLLSLEAGFMFSAMFLAAITVFLIEGRPRRAALWSALAGGFSILGLMHSYSLTPAAVRVEIRPGFAWQAAVGYLILAGIFWLLPVRRTRDPARPPKDGQQGSPAAG